MPLSLSKVNNWIVDTSLHNDTLTHYPNTSYNLEGMIVSFDIAKEEFQFTPHPVDIHTKPFKRCYLINLKGDLAIVESYSFDITTVIWVLKDWKNKQWVKEFAIQILPVFSPMCPSERGLILKFEDYVCKYNFRSYEPGWNHDSILAVTDPQRLDLLKVISFKGSLISLKSFGKLM